MSWLPERRRVGPVGIAAALTATVLLAGCTATSRVAEHASASVTAHPSSSGAVMPSTSPATTAAASPSTPVSSGASTSPSASAVTPVRSTCTKLTVRVLIGSGSLGTEYAAIDFVNDGSTSCTLVGVPTVTLLRNGAQTGTASQPSTAQAPYSQYELTPGATAQSRLDDYSSCNAPLSDSVKVVAPGSTITAIRPGELRACKLVVYPLGAPES